MNREAEGQLDRTLECIEKAQTSFFYLVSFLPPRQRNTETVRWIRRTLDELGDALLELEQ